MNDTKISFKLTFRNVQGYPQRMRFQRRLNKICLVRFLASLNAKTGLFPGLIILETNTTINWNILEFSSHSVWENPEQHIRGLIFLFYKNSNITHDPQFWGSENNQSENNDIPEEPKNLRFAPVIIWIE